jgi:hypothetical protein
LRAIGLALLLLSFIRMGASVVVDVVAVLPLVVAVVVVLAAAAVVRTTGGALVALPTRVGLAVAAAGSPPTPPLVGGRWWRLVWYVKVKAGKDDNAARGAGADAAATVASRGWIDPARVFSCGKASVVSGERAAASPEVSSEDGSLGNDEDDDKVDSSGHVTPSSLLVLSAESVPFGVPFESIASVSRGAAEGESPEECLE